MSLAVVQHGYNASSPTTSATVTLGTAPTAGNLLIAFVQFFSVITNTTINTTTWTIEKGHTISGTDQMWILSRYADGTETATPPDFQTGVFGVYFAATLVEISGVTGVHATDFDQTNLDVGSGGSTTQTSSTLTTAHANELALTGCCGDGGGGGITSFSGGWTSLEAVASGGTIGYSYGLASQLFAASSSSVALTVTYVGSNSGRNIGTVLLNTPSTTVSGTAAQTLMAPKQAAAGKVSAKGTIVQTLSRLTQAALGSSARDGTIVQTLGRLTQAAAGTVVGYKGAIAQTLGRLTQSALGGTGPSGTIAQTLQPMTQAAVGIKATPAGTGTHYVTASGI